MPKTKDIAWIGHAHRNAQKSGSSHCTPCRGHGVHAELRRVHENHNLYDHALGSKEVMGGRDTRRDTGTPSGHPMEHQRAIAALDGRRNGRTDGGETFVLISLQQRSDHFTRHRRRCPSVRQRTGRHTAHHVRSVHVELAVSTKIQQLWS